MLQAPQKRTAKRGGFTFVEVAIAIGIFGVLASVVMVTIGPRTGILSATDARREIHAKNIQGAMEQYSAGNFTVYLQDDDIDAGSENAKMICAQGITTNTTCVSLDDLAPGYVPRLEQDTAEPCSEYLGYIIYKEGNAIIVRPLHLGKLTGDDDITVWPGCNDIDEESSSSSDAGSSASVSPPGSALRFNFNHTALLNQSGYTSVLTSTSYSSATGYGWQGGSIASVDRGASWSNLLRDLHYQSNPRTFSVDLANGDYYVTFTTGDGTRFHDGIQVTLEGVDQSPTHSFLTNQFKHVSYFVTITDGQLNFGLANAPGGVDPNWVINALDIRLASEVGTIALSGPSGSVEADGLTVDTYTAVTSGLPDNSLVTISTTMGKILSPPDQPAAVSRYTGTQALVINNGFSFQIQRPAAVGPGYATITAEEVSGLARGTLTQQYTIASDRRYDCNSSTLKTATGFLSVRGSTVYSETTGIGWSPAVLDVDRTGATFLTRDLCYSGSSTLQVQVKPNTTYYVRTYIGDPGWYHDGFTITPEGGTPFTITSLPQGTVDIRAFPVISADGILTIGFANETGSDPNFVLNGFDISEMALPEEES